MYKIIFINLTDEYKPIPREFFDVESNGKMGMGDVRPFSVWSYELVYDDNITRTRTASTFSEDSLSEVLASMSWPEGLYYLCYQEIGELRNLNDVAITLPQLLIILNAAGIEITPGHAEMGNILV